MGTNRGTNWLLVVAWIVAPSCWVHLLFHIFCWVVSKLLGMISLLIGVILSVGLHIIISEGRGNPHETSELFIRAVITISYQFDEETKIKRGHLFGCWFILSKSPIFGINYLMSLFHFIAAILSLKFGLESWALMCVHSRNLNKTLPTFRALNTLFNSITTTIMQ